MPDPTQKNWEKFQKSGLTRQSTKVTKGNTTVSINFLKPAKKEEKIQSISSPAKPAAKPQTRPVTAKIQAPEAKGPSSNAPYTQSIGSRQIESPTNFRTSQAANVESMNKNYSSANRIATRAAKTRGKGEAALASGNVKKAGRLRKKYDRQTRRLNKKLK